MGSVEANVQRLLDGEAVDEEEEFCDFSLLEQNEQQGKFVRNLASYLKDAAKGITPSAPSSFVPRVKKTVTYIVCGIFLNERDEVLMMQEAKKSCAGKWYLPAGRMEEGETIEDALKRELLEETGLTVSPTTLLMIETAQGSWYRFALTGVVTGGDLKTPSQADSESLQARWVDDVDSLPLRARDILLIITKAKEYRAKCREGHMIPPVGLWHQESLPIIRHHNSLRLRVICLARKKKGVVAPLTWWVCGIPMAHSRGVYGAPTNPPGQWRHDSAGLVKRATVNRAVATLGDVPRRGLSETGNALHVLASEKTALHLPISEVNPMRSVHTTLKRYMTEIFGASLPPHRPHGLLSLEHSPALQENETDGLTLNLLVTIRCPLEDAPLIDKYSWIPIREPLAKHLAARCEKNMTIALNVIRTWESDA
ncbi:unnamed protein product [Cyprideis torosa]|uniref:Uncharacterized protein n=1 Tax=Cyprideis torosa TaxID=163714 RepID=A0A7R8W6Z6_9CRUS|nr:unnamed protein product [Cyprideis torosa]CAG0882782.1 unnamed protein product [Cyprideis torosa]